MTRKPKILKDTVGSRGDDAAATPARAFKVERRQRPRTSRRRENAAADRHLPAAARRPQSRYRAKITADRRPPTTATTSSPPSWRG